MAKFWFATWELKTLSTATESPAEPMLATDVGAVAVEVIEDGGDVAVLLSAADAKSPGRLACRIGFANAADASNMFRSGGFPLVDAAISLDKEKGTLSVISPYFADSLNDLQYENEILTISGLWFDEDDKANQSLVTQYEQSQDGPDYLAPATSILRTAVTWELQHRNVKTNSAMVELHFKLAATRFPRLVPFEGGPLELASVWTGEVELPPRPSQVDSAPAKRLSRTATFGIPAFRFDDVEVIGFRVDLREFGEDYRDKLAQLIAPLNFHLKPSSIAGQGYRSLNSSISDFAYLPATSTLVIELLRYGKMRLSVPEAPLQPIDYQSQHELLVRVLVGRVDDDTAQARDPAVFVPAIFVDNPWSKILGRDVQGFDKRMADFSTWDKGVPSLRLRPDGYAKNKHEKKPRPLSEVARVSLVRTIGAADFGPPILDLSYSPMPDTHPSAFENIDLELALGSSSLSLTRWRQSDFADPEFRRSFARLAANDTLKGFRSIQVSPVGEGPAGERGREETWITGTFEVDDSVRIARPTGVASLTFHASPEAPVGWQQTCALLGIAKGEHRTLPFPAGNWYRMECSMELTIDDGLTSPSAATTSSRNARLA